MFFMSNRASNRRPQRSAQPRNRSRLNLERLEDRTVPSGMAFAVGGASTDASWKEALDSANNLYVGGVYHSSTIDLDRNNTYADNRDILTNAGDRDAFVAKYDPNGNLVWARGINGAGYDGGVWSGLKIHEDAAGTHLYFATDFQSGQVNVGGVQLSKQGAVSDSFVARLDGATGTVDWVRQLGSAGNEVHVSSVSLDAGGLVTFAGTANQPLVVDTGSGSQELPRGLFVIQVDGGNSFQWAQSVMATGDQSRNTTYQVFPTSSGVDDQGNAYIGGYFRETVTFGATNLTASGNTDGFIAKVSASGFQWSKQMGGASAGSPASDISERVSSVTYVDGTVYATGGFIGDASAPATFDGLQFTSQGVDAFLAAVDAGTGAFNWVKVMGGAGDEYAAGVKRDSGGNLYANVFFDGTVDFDPGAGHAYLSSAGGTDIALTKLDSSGNFAWARRIASGTGDDFAGALNLDSAGNVHVSGYFQGTSQFDTGTQLQTLTSAGGHDGYVMKLDQFSRGGAFGRVLSPGGSALAAQSVVLKQGSTTVATATTGGLGEFVFRFLAPGTYSVQTGGQSRAFTLTTAGQFLTDQDLVIALPSLSINSVSKAEGKNGTTAFTFTVTLSAPSTSTVTVNFTTSNGTAVSGSDYNAQSGTLTFAAGQTTKTITILVKGDKTVEANETFFVNLSNAVGATIDDGQGLGTILNDD